MSLNGFIADEKRGTAFLVSDPTYDAGPFFSSIDTVLMGRVTYEEAVRQGMRAYHGLKNYVVSTTLRAADFPEVTMLDRDVEARVAELRAGSGKDIWLCGGGILFGRLLEAGLVDTVELGISPVLLGQGTPMLAVERTLTSPLRLKLTTNSVLPSGLLILEYAVQAKSTKQRSPLLG